MPSALGGLTEGLWANIDEQRKENQRLEDLRSAREQNVLTALLSSPDSEVRTMAMGGLLDAAGPKRRMKGIRGLVGEFDDNPAIQSLHQYLTTPKMMEVMKQVQGLPSTNLMPGTSTAPGPAAPPPPGSAALPSTSPVTGGPMASPAAVGTPPPAAAPPVRRMEHAGPPRVERMESEMRVPQAFYSPEEAQLAQATAQAQGKIAGVRAELKLADFSPEEQQQIIRDMLRHQYGGAAGQTYAEGEITADPESPTGWSQLLYLRADPRVTQKIPAAGPYARSSRVGTTFEQIAGELFGGETEDPRAVASRLTPEQRAQVDAEVRKRAVTQAGNTTTARVDATTKALQNRPLPPNVVATMGVPFGTTPGQMQGLHGQTTQQAQVRTGLTELQAQLPNIRAAVQAALPSAKDLMGFGNVAPGMILAARRRMPQYREQIAAMESAVDIAVNNMARVLGGARGAQSEKDAERAYNALVNLKGGLLTGDTVEASMARLAEAEKAMTAALSVLPDPAGELAAKQAGPPPDPRIGTTVTLKDGRRVKIVGVDPSGKLQVQPAQ